MSTAHLLWLVDRVDAEADDLGVALFEFRLEPGHVAEFRGAHRREILRVRKQDGPAIADPFVKIDGALRGFSGEIRRGSLMRMTYCDTTSAVL